MSWIPLVALLAVEPAHAVPIVIDASDSGWYDDGGDHFASIENYQVGMRGVEYRNFFVFDLTPALGVTIDSAELQIELYNDGFESPDPFETYALFDVGPTSMATLTIGGPGGPIGEAIFADLGTGTSYGSVAVSTSDNGTIVHIPLNAAALAALSSITGPFAFGGAITTHQGDLLIREFAFGSSDENSLRQLVINPDPIPEPGTAFLVGLGLALFGAMSRRLRPR